MGVVFSRMALPLSTRHKGIPQKDENNIKTYDMAFRLQPISFQVSMHERFWRMVRQRSLPPLSKHQIMFEEQQWSLQSSFKRLHESMSWYITQHLPCMYFWDACDPDLLCSLDRSIHIKTVKMALQLLSIQAGFRQSLKPTISMITLTSTGMNGFVLKTYQWIVGNFTKIVHTTVNLSVT